VSSNLPEITILLATYNGDKFLEEQLTSLQLQTGVNVRVIANDDGSSDSTLEILEIWKKRGLISEVYSTERVGPSEAFYSLLERVKDEEYVALSDQDDVWEPSKLETLCKIIDLSNPSLAFCERVYIDLNGKVIGKSKLIHTRTQFENALIENVVPGNTLLLNNQAVKLIQKFRANELEHLDSWIYLLISAFGICKYTNLYLVKYRLHDDNAVGIRKFNLKNISSKLETWRTQASLLQELAQDQLNERVRSQLLEFLQLYSTVIKLHSFRRVLGFKFHRQRRSDAFAIKALFLCRLFLGIQLWRRLTK